MAGLAIGREIGGRMTRIGGAVVSRLVTRETLCRRTYVSARMTGDTHDTDMGTGQRECRRIVIEGCR